MVRSGPRLLGELETETRALIVHAGVLEGAIAVCVVLGTYALLGLPPDGPLLVLAFCGTASVYGLDRAAGFSIEDQVNRPGRTRWWRRRRGVAILFGLAGLAMVPALEPATQGAGVLLAMLSALYVLPLLPGRRRLKAYGLLKPFVIGAGWGVGAVMLPVIEAGAVPGTSALLLLGSRALTVTANALLTDWPDRTGDASAGVTTFAVRWSWRYVQRGAVVVLLGALLCEGFLLFVAPPALVFVDAAGVGGLLLFAAVLNPARARFTLTLDLVVAWPLMTALVAWW